MIFIKKNNSYLVSVLLLIFLIQIFSCTNKLLIPLKNGKLIEYKKSFMAYDGGSIYILPSKDKFVFAAENSKVLVLEQISSSEFILCLKGKYFITYASLKNCSVKSGETIKEGTLLGELHSKELTMVINKNDSVYILNPKFKNK